MKSEKWVPARVENLRHEKQENETEVNSKKLNFARVATQYNISLSVSRLVTITDSFSVIVYYDCIVYNICV